MKLQPTIEQNSGVAPGWIDPDFDDFAIFSSFSLKDSIFYYMCLDTDCDTIRLASGTLENDNWVDVSFSVKDLPSAEELPRVEIGCIEAKTGTHVWFLGVLFAIHILTKGIRTPTRKEGLSAWERISEE